jgi:hypothetical protein
MLMVLLLAVSLGRVEGVVTTDHFPLPGAVVTLQMNPPRTRVTNVDGRYAIEGVPAGVYELTITLEGFDTAKGTITVAGGKTAVENAELIASPAPLSCDVSLCSDEPPATRYDQPQCADHELDALLIERIRSGDPSAIALARTRFENAFTFQQKHTLAGALLGTGRDSDFWKELVTHAEIALRLPPDTELATEYEQWAAAQGLHPQQHQRIALAALSHLSGDARSRTLLHRALNSGNVDVAEVAIQGFARQHDLSALPAIERVMKAFGGHSAIMLAWSLVDYDHEEADKLAFSYLDEAQRESYRQLRGVAAGNGQ